MVVAPDKFKGSLTAQQVASAVAQGLRTAIPHADVVEFPIADGGEGTVQMMLTHGWEQVDCAVTGPTGDIIEAAYAFLGSCAVMEMSAAAGLALVPDGPTSESAMGSTTFGVGEMIADALNRGAHRIVIGVGGSATTDGGQGALRALGAVIDTGSATFESIDPRLSSTDIVVVCDVDNPLTGPTGAAEIYGPQKGATRHDVGILDEHMQHWADQVEEATGHDSRSLPGAGAAGGLAFGLAAVLRARLVPGIDFMLEFTGFEQVLIDTDLVVVGEGSLDGQSLRGKGPIGVARAAHKQGVPVVAAVGRSEVSDDEAREAGVSDIYALTSLEPNVEIAMKEAARLLHIIGARIGDRYAEASSKA
ncbi:glycerate kinase [Rhodococcus fascians]|nr:glycerate kinase [Rhodococcus fascians]